MCPQLHSWNASLPSIFPMFSTENLYLFIISKGSPQRCVGTENLYLFPPPNLGGGPAHPPSERWGRWPCKVKFPWAHNHCGKIFIPFKCTPGPTFHQPLWRRFFLKIFSKVLLRLPCLCQQQKEASLQDTKNMVWQKISWNIWRKSSNWRSFSTLQLFFLAYKVTAIELNSWTECFKNHDPALPGPIIEVRLHAELMIAVIVP